MCLELFLQPSYSIKLLLTYFQMNHSKIFYFNNFCLQALNDALDEALDDLAGSWVGNNQKAMGAADKTNLSGDK